MIVNRLFSKIHLTNKFCPSFFEIGTGKTGTLVAAIEEIVLSSTRGTVLVCASSNAACDEITERLLKVLVYGQMFRMYAITYNVQKISDEIKPICNLVDEQLCIPSLKFLSRFPVLICTLSATGCLSRAKKIRYGCGRYVEKIDPIQFSHIIIDECASTHETETMIPIAGKHFI